MSAFEFLRRKKGAAPPAGQEKPAGLPSYRFSSFQSIDAKKAGRPSEPPAHDTQGGPGPELPGGFATSKTAYLAKIKEWVPKAAGLFLGGKPAEAAHGAKGFAGSAAKAIASAAKGIAGAARQGFARVSAPVGPLNPMAAKGAAALAALAVIAVAAINLGPSPSPADAALAPPDSAFGVAYGGELLGYVIDEGDFDTVLTGAKVSIFGDNPGLNVAIDDSKLECYGPEDVSGQAKLKLLTAEDLKDKLLSSGDCKAEAWGLSIDGAQILTVASEQAAKTVMEKVKASYINKGSELIEADIKEAVEIAPIHVDLGEGVMDVDAAASYVLTGTKEPKVYTVVKGDTLWDIAIANNISQAEIEKANPGLVPERLKIDQQLNLYEVKPYVTIKTVEVASKVEPLAFSTTYQNSDEFYKGQTKVLKPGVTGKREVRTQITKENGQVVETVEIGAVITAEPEAQISAVGTKPLSTFTGTGSLMQPLANLEISSAYGSRGNRRHQGVDLRSPKGTPIYAADDGVVTISQYKGSYGKLIVLNHGNGVETYYGHCDTLQVAVGDVVNKGDLIGTVGITGNATGYHLHFEVRKNGVYQNPMNYF